MECHVNLLFSNLLLDSRAKDQISYAKRQKETSLKIFKHYKLKPSFPIMIKDNKKKDRAGVGDKPPPPSFVRSINPNFIQKLIRSEMDQFRFDPMWSILIQLDYVFDIV